MDEQEKPFDTVSIVILLILAVLNDGAEIVFDLLAMTGVGIVGEAIMEPANFVMDAIVSFWFMMKCGLGGTPTIMQYLDDLLELAGIPGRTICVGAGIVFANNPKLIKVAEVAGVAALTGGAGAAAAAEAGEATEVGAIATEGAAATGGAVTAEGGMAAETTTEAGSATSRAGGVGGAGEAGGEAQVPSSEDEGVSAPEEGVEPSEEEGAKEKREELEREMETEEERPPEEIAQEKIFEQVSKNKDEEDEEESAEQNGQSSNVVAIDSRQKRAEETKQKQEQLPKMIDVGDDQEESDLEAAA